MVTDPFERRQRKAVVKRLVAQRSCRPLPKKDFTTEAQRGLCPQPNHGLGDCSLTGLLRAQLCVLAREMDAHRRAALSQASIGFVNFP
jgi:hypothetical protein